MVKSTQEAFDLALQIVDEARHFGYQILPDGARVFGRVPHVAPRAWLHKVYPPLQERELTLLEGSLHRPIPEAYRTWLTLANGLNVFSEAFVLDGRRADYSRQAAVVQPYDLALANVLERPRDADPETFFVGSLLEAEYLLYLMPSTGVVHACSRRRTIPLTTWESLPALITSVMVSLKAAFDNEGRALRQLELRDLSPGPVN